MLAVAEQSTDRAARLITRRFESSADADRHDLEFWMQIQSAMAFSRCGV